MDGCDQLENSHVCQSCIDQQHLICTSTTVSGMARRCHRRVGALGAGIVAAQPACAVIGEHRPVCYVSSQDCISNQAPSCVYSSQYDMDTLSIHVYI